MIDVHGVVPVWVAYETGVAQDERRFSVSWFREVDPPYRRGKGIRLRIGARAFHVGLQRRSGAKSMIDVFGRELDVDSEEIGEWRGNQDVPEEDR